MPSNPVRTTTSPTPSNTSPLTETFNFIFNTLDELEAAVAGTIGRVGGPMGADAAPPTSDGSLVSMAEVIRRRVGNVLNTVAMTNAML